MQLVARTSAPPEPITWQQSPESVVFKADRAGHERTFLAHIHHVTRRIIGRVPSVDVHMLFKTFFAQESQKTFAVEQSPKKVVDEQSKEKLAVKASKKALAVKQVKVAAAQNKSAGEPQVKELDRNKVEMMKLIEAKAQVERANVEEQKAGAVKRRAIELRKLVEARTQAERAELEASRRQTLGDVLRDQFRETARQQEMLNQQLEEMLKRQEELEAQNRVLREELERLRRATPRE